MKICARHLNTDYFDSIELPKVVLIFFEHTRTYRLHRQNMEEWIKSTINILTWLKR